ncbi:MAG: hypothetical protein JNL57_05850 [Bacteroidetes bacterium]|nr:hypothetical protein [Bacteroidota bacterium]
MLFADIPGQDALKNRLRSGRSTGRVPHAQLFLGAEGSGNLALALAYLQYLHCSEVSETDSCGQCSSCRKFSSLTHPDLHFTFPFPSNKADVCSELYAEWRKAVLDDVFITYENWMSRLSSENKQGNIPTKECHAILRNLALKPFEDGYKMLVMWLPEYLGSEGNVLLKMLEEPPQRTLFILVATNPDKILTTILSRTQLVRVPPLEDAAISAWLQTHAGTEAGDADRVALMSAGDLVKARELAENAENVHLEPFRNWLAFCYKRDMAGAQGWAEEYGTLGREKLKAFLLYSLELLRAIAVYPIMGNKGGLTETEATFVSNFSRIIQSSDQLEFMNSAINDAIYEIERNGNGKMILADLSYKLARALKKN